jgi:hypothetical protein
VNAYVWSDSRVILIPNVDKIKNVGQVGDVVELQRGVTSSGTSRLLPNAS